MNDNLYHFNTLHTSKLLLDHDRQYAIASQDDSAGRCCCW